MRTYRKVWTAFLLSLFTVSFGFGCAVDEADPVGEPEILEFSASRTEVDAGGEIVLRWSVRGASHVALYANDERIAESGDLEGEVVHAIHEQTLFRLEARGQGGSTSRTLEVRVSSAELPRVIAFAAEPAETMAGGVVNLAWETEGATAVQISDGDNELSSGDGPLPTSGSLELVIEEDTTFTLVASNDSGEQEATLEVLAHAEPLVDFTASALAIEPGESTTLSWSVVWATEVTVSGPDGVIWQSEGELSGSVEVSPLVDTEYHLVAEGAKGSITETLSITVAPLPPPTIVDFDVFPRQAAPGETVTISWEASGAAHLAVAWNGVVFHEEEVEAPVGRVQRQVDEEGLVRLAARNLLGAEVVETIQVTVGPLEIVAFDAPASPVRDGGPLVFSWENLGGIHLALEREGATIFEATDRETIEAGEFTYHPEEMGELHFALVLTNGLGDQLRASHELHYTDGPIVEQLAIAQTKMCTTDLNSLSWQVSEGADGEATTLTVEVGGQVEEFTGPGALTGSFELGGLPSGVHEVLVTAKAPGKTAHRKTMEVRVFDGLHLDALEISPPTPQIDDEVTISWEAICADDVVLDGGVEPWLAGDPFEDITATGTMREPEDACGGTGFPQDDGCVDVIFPSGFTFPFFGENQSKIRVYIDGAAGFSTPWVGEPGDNSELPDLTKAWMNFAVFWMDLWGDFFNVDSEEIGILTEVRGTAPNRRMIIQWANLIEKDFGGMAYLETYEFQLVLFESGRFEFRYGTMHNAAVPAIADGSLASIGFQTSAGDVSHQITFRGAVPDGLLGRTFVFDAPVMDAKGSLTFKLERPMDFELILRGPAGELEHPFSIAP